jgi:hypothetical protein
MYSRDEIDTREAQIAKITETEEDRVALRKHLKEVIEGKTFRGSNRSGQFLEHIVGQAVAGNFEALKERVIGIELFGRPTSFDTGADSIVRVTANDVRKRLAQHYALYGASSEFRIILPVGSYIPEITRSSGNNSGVQALLGEPGLIEAGPAGTAAEGNSTSAPTVPVEAPPVLFHPATGKLPGKTRRWWLTFALAFAVLNLALWGVFWRRLSPERDPQVNILPWSALFNSSHSTVLITSDPDIAEIQVLTGQPVSVADYARGRYIPEPNALTAEEIQFCREFLMGDKPAEIDAQMAADIAQVAEARSRGLAVRGARRIQISDLHTNDNFILLGSPRSNPWTDLFSDQLDFRFARDMGPKGTGPNRDSILNANPRPNELRLYAQAAPGGVGQSFGIIAFIPNLDRSGEVLIIAGVSREGTEAAGKFAVDLPRLSAALQNCGISPSGPVRHFELLLGVSILAGSPNRTDVVACHVLPDASARH